MGSRHMGGGVRGDCHRTAASQVHNRHAQSEEEENARGSKGREGEKGMRERTDTAKVCTKPIQQNLTASPIYTKSHTKSTTQSDLEELHSSAVMMRETSNAAGPVLVKSKVSPWWKRFRL